jgi:hypothetical protein
MLTTHFRNSTIQPILPIEKNTTPFLITMENYPGEGQNYLPHLICKNISPSWSTVNVVAPPGKNLQQDYLVQINLASY